MLSKGASVMLGLASRARRRGPDLVVLAYHGVPDASALEAHLEVLSRRFELIGLHDLDALAHDGPRCLITFDDGERSVYDVARPLLASRGVPAVAFVVAGLIDTDEPFWWTEVDVRLRAQGHRAPQTVIRDLKRCTDRDRLAYLERLRAATSDTQIDQANLTSAELRQLEQDAIAVGNHSLTHPLLDNCDDEKVVAEIATAHRLLTGWLGHEPDAIAYPNGNLDPRAIEAARSCGYRYGFLFDHRVTHGPLADPLRISRVRIDVTHDLETLRARVTGLHPAVHHRLGRS